tara:strand:- start:6771 stop:7016 length:246 start_codon:yes stop_codon:yes gene_type:complete
MNKGIKQIHVDCDATVSQDKTLPSSAFLVEYLQDGTTKFDIVISSKISEIFDYYWDNYRGDLKNITQAEGRANPKLWNPKK